MLLYRLAGNLVSFAAPPRCASTWMLNAFSACGERDGSERNSFAKHQRDTEPSRIKITTVRNPFEWLVSFWQVVDGPTTINEVDAIFEHKLKAANFPEFVEAIVEDERDLIPEMFDSYNGDIVLRVEDLPWAFDEMLTTFGVRGVEDKWTDEMDSRINVCPRKLKTVAAVDKKDVQRRALFDRHREFYERYEYFGR
jgi:predicted Zn-dependent protease with MMP-like domain